MNIETVINDMFEEEIGRLKTCVPPYRGDIPVPAHKGKGLKERYGPLVLCMIMVSVISIFSLRTGMLRSPLLIEWRNITALIPENFINLFFESITANL